MNGRNGTKTKTNEIVQRREYGYVPLLLLRKQSGKQNKKALELLIDLISIRFRRGGEGEIACVDKLEGTERNGERAECEGCYGVLALRCDCS